MPGRKPISLEGNNDLTITTLLYGVPLSNTSLKIDYYDTMLTYIESILKVVQNRTYQIKNAIEFMRFQSGLG